MERVATTYIFRGQLWWSLIGNRPYIVTDKTVLCTLKGTLTITLIRLYLTKLLR